MPVPTYQDFPLSIIVLAYVATGILLVIMILLSLINAKLAAHSRYLSRSSRPAKPGEAGSEPNLAEVGPGTPFEEFLSEDPERRKIPKKDQFKAYRQWRSEKGLNWSAKY